MTSLFFLSYARVDEDRDVGLVRKLFHDLSADMRELVGVGAGHDVGFFDDRSLRVGMPWREALLAELGTAQTFVALTSPRYFASEWCAREWAVFSRRIDQVGGRAPAMVPVTWVPAAVPPVAQTVQWHDFSLGERYRETGLRELMRLGMYRDDYRRVVWTLARRIVEVGRQYRVPPLQHIPDFDAEPNIFAHPPASDMPANVTADPDRRGRPILNVNPVPVDVPFERD